MKAFIVGVFIGIGLIAVTQLHSTEVAKTPAPHRYKIVSGDDSVTTLYGDKIHATDGFCVELYLNGRVDTIMCGIKYITELPPETEEVPVPDSAPEPILPPRGTSPSVAHN